MKVYKCIFSGAELCSDSYDQIVPFEDDRFKNVAFEVKGTRIPVNVQDYGIADNSEEGKATGGGSGETVIDIENAFHLTSIQMTPEEFTTYIKAYLKRIVDFLQENTPSRVEGFKTESAMFVKKLLKNLDQYEFLMPDSDDCQGAIVLSYYKDEEIAPRFLFFKDGIKEEKY